jgi:hypothetical protein
VAVDPLITATAITSSSWSKETRTPPRRDLVASLSRTGTGRRMAGREYCPGDSGEPALHRLRGP